MRGREMGRVKSFDAWFGFVAALSVVSAGLSIWAIYKGIQFILSVLRANGVKGV